MGRGFVNVSAHAAEPLPLPEPEPWPVPVSKQLVKILTAYGDVHVHVRQTSALAVAGEKVAGKKRTGDCTIRNAVCRRPSTSCACAPTRRAKPLSGTQ
jgi:hypothetical protein